MKAALPGWPDLYNTPAESQICNDVHVHITDYFKWKACQAKDKYRLKTQAETK